MFCTTTTSLYQVRSTEQFISSRPDRPRHYIMTPTVSIYMIKRTLVESSTCIILYTTEPFFPLCCGVSSVCVLLDGVCMRFPVLFWPSGPYHIYIQINPEHATVLNDVFYLLQHALVTSIITIVTHSFTPVQQTHHGSK